MTIVTPSGEEINNDGRYAWWQAIYDTYNHQYAYTNSGRAYDALDALGITYTDSGRTKIATINPPAGTKIIVKCGIAPNDAWELMTYRLYNSYNFNNPSPFKYSAIEAKVNDFKTAYASQFGASTLDNIGAFNITNANYLIYDLIMNPTQQNLQNAHNLLSIIEFETYQTVGQENFNDGVPACPADNQLTKNTYPDAQITVPEINDIKTQIKYDLMKKYPDELTKSSDVTLPELSDSQWQSIFLYKTDDSDIYNNTILPALKSGSTTVLNQYKYSFNSYNGKYPSGVTNVEASKGLTISDPSEVRTYTTDCLDDTLDQLAYDIWKYNQDNNVNTSTIANKIKEHLK